MDGVCRALCWDIWLRGQVRVAKIEDRACVERGEADFFRVFDGANAGRHDTKIRVSVSIRVVVDCYIDKRRAWDGRDK